MNNQRARGTSVLLGLVLREDDKLTVGYIPVTSPSLPPISDLFHAVQRLLADWRTEHESMVFTTYVVEDPLVWPPSGGQHG